LASIILAGTVFTGCSNTQYSDSSEESSKDSVGSVTDTSVKETENDSSSIINSDTPDTTSSVDAVDEDTDTIKDDTTAWKNAYKEVVEAFEAEYDSDCEYAFVYVDDNDIPKLYATAFGVQTRRLYSYYENEAVLLITGEGKYNMFSPSSCKKKSGKIWTIGSGGFKNHVYECFVIADGMAESVECVFLDSNEEYTIDGISVSEEEFRRKEEEYNNYSSQ